MPAGRHGSPADLLRLMQEHDQWWVFSSPSTGYLTGASPCVCTVSTENGPKGQLTDLLVCAVPPQLLPRLLQAQQLKCPHCRTTQGLPEGLGAQQEAQVMSAAPGRATPFACCLNLEDRMLAI